MPMVTVQNSSHLVSKLCTGPILQAAKSDRIVAKHWILAFVVVQILFSSSPKQIYLEALKAKRLERMSAGTPKKPGFDRFDGYWKWKSC
jgi:hypothetical protein